MKILAELQNACHPTHDVTKNDVNMTLHCSIRKRAPNFKMRTTLRLTSQVVTSMFICCFITKCVTNAEICIIMAGRPAAPIRIRNNVLPHNALVNLDCVPRDLYGNISDCMHWLMWLAEHRLVRDSDLCGKCQHQMCLTRREESPDGFS